MAFVRRLFVEKRAEFGQEARHLLSDLRELLGLSALADLRLFKRYDVQGLSDDGFVLAVEQVFSEPICDIVTHEELPEMNAKLLTLEYLPGQYDLRADAAAQCAQALLGGERPLVRCATVYAFFGNISESDFSAIRNYLLNPVESREASLAKPETLEQAMPEPDDIVRLNSFIKASDGEIAELVIERGMAMTAADLRHVRDYFRDVEKRPPTETELRVIDTYWSDHCRHTTFLTAIDQVAFDTDPLNAPAAEAWASYLKLRQSVYAGEKRDVSLMDIAVIGMKALKKRGLLEDLDQSDEINACSIRVTAKVDGRDEDWLVMFKNETHNHPTEIEPFGGAATCLGGAIRDPLSGRSYVYQAMRVTGAADVRQSLAETLPGKLPQRLITQSAAAGYSSYGNQIGLATGQVKEIYHPGYMAKRMELGAVIGAAPASSVYRDVPAPGDVVLLVGGRTGRDGCGGATGSSKAHTLDSLETCGAEVQKGVPPIERSLLRLFRKPQASTLIKRCNDFGAGGVCVAIGELADGLKINLDAVPKKYEGLDGTELAISESQERMAVVLAAKDVETFIRLAAEENLEATQVAVVSDEPRLVMHWRGDCVVNISRQFLNTNGVTQHAVAAVKAPDENDVYFARLPEELRGDRSLSESWLHNLQQLSVCGQRGLQERFDGTIGASTVLSPLGGAYQRTEAQAMVAKLPVTGETETCTIMAHGFDPHLSSWSPFHGAAWAVVDSLAKLAAVGGDASKARLSLQEFFERLGSDATRWGKPLAALLGALTAQLQLSVPAIGGKDSMSGSFQDLDVPPTLVAFCVGTANTSSIRAQELKAAGNALALLPCPRDDKHLPVWETLKRNFATLNAAIKNGLVLSAYAVGAGGVAAAVSRMAMGNMIGAKFTRNEGLFTSDYGSFALELAPGVSADAIEGAIALGVTLDTPVIEVGSSTISLEDVAAAWDMPLSNVFPMISPSPMADAPLKADCSQRGTAKAPRSFAKPKVIIPAFPGTNCEEDSARAFNMAGANAEVFVMRNVTPTALAESMEAFTAALNSAQILMLPGGFSCGDEPDGSAKYISSILRSPNVRAAIEGLLARDGLILGICNGFQALIKTGLLPFGKFINHKPGDPTMTFNAVGRHVARYVTTRVASVKSPWMAGCEVGDVHTIPVSHGEGRVAMSQEWLTKISAAGQIATQYADLCGEPTMREPFNPNGSIAAIEGLLSPDGRILGKMGHSERVGENVAINIPGNKRQSIFASGVLYYS